MTSSGRYDTSGYPEDQYEPGSDGKVLKNRLRITSREEMEIAETEYLWKAQEHLLDVVEEDQQFTAHDIFEMHRTWLGVVYEWAGKERRVNVSKDGFTFAMAHTITGLMLEFERKQLSRYTPCRFDSYDKIAQALAEVHVELMLIHPFREGNGRLGRLLATIMALQAGLPLLDFSEMACEKKDEYFLAVRVGLEMNYAPMKQLFLDVIESSEASNTED
ncbi:Fic/DOC family protein [Pelobacter seleniigenes]|uniref:Fic/DOC family protein n=1 Tax=Pelobacter seleniigenes TaxID=407188 RepID=UPI0004A6C88E|nr:Fic family protein [Pelobacter seleniigenes]